MKVNERSDKTFTCSSQFKESDPNNLKKILDIKKKPKYSNLNLQLINNFEQQEMWKIRTNVKTKEEEYTHFH